MTTEKGKTGGDTPTTAEELQTIAGKLTDISTQDGHPLNVDTMGQILHTCFNALQPEQADILLQLLMRIVNKAERAEVTEVRPKELECDVVRFQNNKDKWVALVGLLNGHPYEIFTGLQDDDEGIMLPKSVTHGKIVKQVNEDGTKRYDFQFVNKRGYKTTVEGLSEKFNPEYWNYAKLISGVLRYRMPIAHVVRLVASLQLQSESINTWKVGVERALKKYVNDGTTAEKEGDDADGQ